MLALLVLFYRFQDQSSADEFYRAFNGLPFNSLEPEVCSLAYVSKVETCKESEFDPLSGLVTDKACLMFGFYIYYSWS